MAVVDECDHEVRAHPGGMYANFPMSGGDRRLTSNITLTGSSGKSATIGFDGSEVTFSGDLPVDAAARLFFIAVFENVKFERERGK